MKQVVLFVTVVLAIISALVVAWQLIGIVLLFLVSLVIAATVRAPIEALHQRGLSRMVATSFVYILLFGFIVALLLTISASLMDETERFLTDLVEIYEQVQSRWEGAED
ncbi:MAG: AI-2E family transporter [Caldilineaceae bacterium]